MSRFTINSVLVILSVVLLAGHITTRTFAQNPNKECDGLISQINDSVDKVAKIGEQIGEYEEKIEKVGRDSEHGKSIQKSVESMKASLRKMKVTIETLAEKLCECCGKELGKPADSHMQCNSLISQINDSVDKVAKIGEQIGEYEEKVEEAGRDSEHGKSIQKSVESMKASLRKMKVTIETLAEKLCECCAKKPDSTGKTQTSFKTNQINLNFSFIREDSNPRFNTYGFNGSFTHYVNPTVGLTGDFNGHFKSESGVDLSKYSVLGGVTFVPFEGAKTTDKVTVSTHALFGVSHFKADSGSSGFTDNAFTMKLGGALDVNVNENFFVRPVQIDYAPTRFGGSFQHNVQFSFGIGFRF
ncbi:MAG: hypothetical protein ACT4OT_14200 [Acidobacteriota bacterium]